MKKLYNGFAEVSMGKKIKKEPRCLRRDFEKQKKYVAEPPPEAKGVKYISAGAPTGVKKAKDA